MVDHGRSPIVVSRLVATTPDIWQIARSRSRHSCYKWERWSLERLDLNLLRVFQALEAERHVTRAAARLGLTQSAASNAWPVSGRPSRTTCSNARPPAWSPRPWLASWRPRSRAALDAVRAAVRAEPAVRACHRRDEFVVGVSDYAEFALAPPWSAVLRERAPGVSVVSRHADREGALALLDQDRRRPRGRHLPRAAGTDDPDGADAGRFRCAAAARPSRGGRVARPRPLSRLAASAGVPGRQPGGSGGPGAGQLDRQRELAVVVSHHLVVAPILLGSTLLCTLARRLATPLAAAFGLATRALPDGTGAGGAIDFPGVPQPLCAAAGTSLAAHAGRRDGPRPNDGSGNNSPRA